MLEKLKLSVKFMQYTFKVGILNNSISWNFIWTQLSLFYKNASACVTNTYIRMILAARGMTTSSETAVHER